MGIVVIIIGINTILLCLGSKAAYRCMAAPKWAILPACIQLRNSLLKVLIISVLVYSNKLR